MPKYDLNALGHEEFELMCQSLLQQIIGPGVKVYGMGSDGAREATFQGKATYPSQTEQWDGKWIFQVKFHDVLQLGQSVARRQIISDIDDELDKICEKFKHPCDNYLLLTNVSLSPVFQKGIKDRIDNDILPKYRQKIKHLQVLGAEEICRLLDGYPNIRQAYSHFLVSGDVIAQLMGIIKQEENELVELVKLYCQGCFVHERSAALDDAGDLDDKPIELQQVLIDLDVMPIRVKKDQQTMDRLPKWLAQASDNPERTSALSYLLDDSVQGLVLIGGPGEGKSTLGQYIAQIHRACLIEKVNDFIEDVIEINKIAPRIPFRIILRDYAQWITSQTNSDSLVNFLRLQVSRESGKNVSSEDIYKIIKSNPVLLILDGLDEVAEKKVRKRVLDNIAIIVNQIRDVLNGNIRVIATTRPSGYSEEFDPNHFLHLSLLELEPEKAINYSNKWIKAREPDIKEAERIITTFTLCLEDPIVQVLTKTPLQVTILLVIIRARGTPPKQKEELYERYMDIIYQREQKRRPELLRTEQHIIYGLHKYLAYILHRREESKSTAALMDIDEFREKVGAYILHNNPLLNESEINEKTEQIIIEASTRLVLIESPKAGKVGFGLKTTREFFAAAHLVDTAKDTKQRDLRFRAIARSPHWRNVALFFAGRVGRTRPGEAPSMIDVCRKIDTEQYDKHLKRGANLVCELVDDHTIREDYNEIGAIQFCLTLFENYIMENELKVISMLINLPEQYKERVIHPWFMEKLKTVSFDNIMPYIRNYQKLFGFNNQLIEMIFKINTSEIKLWALNKAVEEKIVNNWVIMLIEDLDASILFSESTNIDFNIKDEDNILFDLMSLQSSSKVRAFLAKEYLRHLNEIVYGLLITRSDRSCVIIPDKYAELTITSNDNHNKLFLWGIIQLTKLFYQDDYKGTISVLKKGRSNKDVKFDLIYYVPLICFKKVRTLLNVNNRIIQRFCTTFKEDPYEITNILVSLYDFLIDIKLLDKYSLLIKNTNNSSSWIKAIISLIIGTFPSNDQQYIEIHNQINSLIPNYKLYVQHIQNTAYRLINHASNKELPRLTHSWGTSGSYKGVISKIMPHGWISLSNKKLLNNNFSLFHWRINGDQRADTMGIILDIIGEQLAVDPVNIEFFFPLLFHDWSDPITVKLNYTERVRKIFEYFITNTNIIENNSRVFYGFFWILLRAGVIDEDIMVKIYNHYHPISKLPFGPYRIYEEKTSGIIPMLENDKIKVRRLAGVLLSALQNAVLPSDFKEKLNQKVGNNLWSLAQDVDDVWRSQYINAMSLCQLDWSGMWECWLYNINNLKVKEVQNSWINVIKEARYGYEDKSALIKFLINIIESNMISSTIIKNTALDRLQKIVSTTEFLDFDENYLNLPLSRRNKVHS